MMGIVEKLLEIFTTKNCKNYSDEEINQLFTTELLPCINDYVDYHNSKNETFGANINLQKLVLNRLFADEVWTKVEELYNLKIKI